MVRRLVQAHESGGRPAYQVWPVHQNTLTVKPAGHEGISVGATTVEGRKIHWIRASDGRGNAQYLGPLDGNGRLLKTS